MERAKRMDLQRKIDAILASSVLVASLKQECYWELEGVADLLVLVCSPEKNNVIDKFPAFVGKFCQIFFNTVPRVQVAYRVVLVVGPYLADEVASVVEGSFS